MVALRSVVERAAAVGRRIESSADIAPAIANLWIFTFPGGSLDDPMRFRPTYFELRTNSMTRKSWCRPITAAGQLDFFAAFSRGERARRCWRKALR